ncbi:hypothetical protein CR513_28898, partial [Mucuna pruriens]
MASNTQQFGIKGAALSRMVNEVSAIDNLRLENQLIEMTSLVSRDGSGSRWESALLEVGHGVDPAESALSSRYDFLVDAKFSLSAGLVVGHVAFLDRPVSLMLYLDCLAIGFWVICSGDPETENGLMKLIPHTSKISQNNIGCWGISFLLLKATLAF